MKKIYRIFISSCKRLLEKERQILSDVILMKEHLPVQMEYNFLGSNTATSIEIDMEKLREADGVIFIFNYLYGEVIGKKFENPNICPLKERKIKYCNSCSDLDGCVLSFTHFEYEYAKLLDKPIVVIYNPNYNDEETFLQANTEYKEIHNGKDCQRAFYEHESKYTSFLTTVMQKHAFPYNNHDEFVKVSISAVGSIEDLLKRRETNGVVDQGLISYAYFSESEKQNMKITTILNQIKESGIEASFDCQASALKALEQEKDIYLGNDGKVQDIRILAIRGSSFTGGMGHEWRRFILDEEFKKDEVINVEFVLSNYRNETLIKERYTAFLPQQTNEKTLEAYKREYINDMKKVQQEITKYHESHPCKLFLHNEAKLPFRMIFIGKYLYLSTFLRLKKAVETPVMKIPYTSTLYKVCEEYYEWVKYNAEERL